jgi:hypothetical protein
MRSTSVELLHGFPYQNAYVKHVNLRELRGDDENALANTTQVPSFIAAIDLLNRVASIDQLLRPEQVAGFVNEISIGDRNKLMLELYRLCMGNFFDLVISCPFCSKEMSLELGLEKLLKNSQSAIKEDDALNTAQHLLKLRAVTGADQMRFLEIDDSRRGKQEFVKLCIVSSEPPLEVGPLPDEIISAISTRLDQIDPLADPILNMVCPTCQSAFLLSLDIDKLVISGIKERNSQFQKEAHWLAFYYHWSEDSIMSLPVSKRKQYIEMIGATLTGELTL